jgi:hypothetical protein
VRQLSSAPCSLSTTERYAPNPNLKVRVLLPISVLKLVGLLLNRQCEQHAEDIGASEDVKIFVDWEYVISLTTMRGPCSVSLRQ